MTAALAQMKRRLAGVRRREVMTDDVSVFAELAAAREAVLLEEFDGRAEEKPAWRLTARGDLGDRLHQTAAALCDLLERTLQRHPSDALAAMSWVDVEALNPPVGTRRRRLFIGAPVLDAGELLGITVLAPALRTPLIVKDKSGVRPSLVDATMLARAILLGIGARQAFGIAAHAPAATEDPVVALDELRERAPGTGIQRSCAVRHEQRLRPTVDGFSGQVKEFRRAMRAVVADKPGRLLPA